MTSRVARKARSPRTGGLIPAVTLRALFPGCPDPVVDILCWMPATWTPRQMLGFPWLHLLGRDSSSLTLDLGPRAARWGNGYSQA